MTREPRPGTVEFEDGSVFARQLHQAFDRMAGIKIEQVAHQHVARWARDRLQARRRDP